MKLASGSRWHLHFTPLTAWAFPLAASYDFGTITIQFGPIELGLDVTDDV